MARTATDVGRTIVFILLSPLILCLILLALIIWIFFTVTLIGPLTNYILSRYEEFELPPDVRRLQTPQGYHLAIRYSGWAHGYNSSSTEQTPLRSSSSPSSARHYPIIIPNGLAATMASIGNIHDKLVQAGFQVVSFDRYGVGLSDENPTDISPTVGECVQEVLFVMNSVLPQQEKWHILGPSMGAIVAQCFIAKHPEKIVGFLNMDGFPAAFENKREKFVSASGIWNFVGLCTYTGIMRLALLLAPLKEIASSSFPVWFLRAQMNQRRFYRNTRLEFPLMLDLAQEGTQAWGSLAVAHLEPEHVEALIRAKPHQNGRWENGAWHQMPRSAVEHGDDWNTDEQTDELVRALKAKPQPEIARTWERLSVRVMNGRDYNYAGGDSFYDQEMKDKAAAENQLHALLARDGARYVFPHRGHDKMFLEVEAIVQCMIEIDDSAAHINQI